MKKNTMKTIRILLIAFGVISLFASASMARDFKRIILIETMPVLKPDHARGDSKSNRKIERRSRLLDGAHGTSG